MNYCIIPYKAKSLIGNTFVGTFTLEYTQTNLAHHHAVIDFSVIQFFESNDKLTDANPIPATFG